MTMAKAINNAAIPMGAVAASRTVHDAIVNNGAPGAIELFHGYTYSAHPVAAAAAIATLDLYRREDLFGRAASLAPVLEAAAHSLRDAKHVKDIRNLGLVAGVELESRAGAPGARAYEAFVKCYEAGVLIRFTGDILAFSPPLIIDEAQIGRIFETVREALAAIQ
jgi:beta-alanine--pyruvate transaminase